jgi:hypothetical protein
MGKSYGPSAVADHRGGARLSYRPRLTPPAIPARLRATMTAAHREFPPYISYLIVTVMSVASLALQATVPFKIKALWGDFGAVGFLFMWASF